MPNSRDFLRVADVRRDFLNEQRRLLAEELTRYRAEAERLEQVAERTRLELGGYLVPDVEDEELEGLERRYQTVGLLAAKRRVEATLEEGAARLAKLAQMDEVENHAVRAHEVQLRLDETEPTWQAVDNEVATVQHNEWFVDLESRGYFAPDYDTWLVGHFRDWRAVSFLMAAIDDDLGVELDDPDALLAWWLERRQTHEEVGLLWRNLSREKARITALNEEHARLTRQPEELLAALYDELGQLLLDHLWALDSAQRQQLLASDARLVTTMKRQRGLTKQAAYLRELGTIRIQARIDALDRELAKLERKIIKARVKYKNYAQSTLDGMANLKAEKWAKRHRRLEKLRRRIGGFDRWDAGALDDDFLWWDLVTKNSNGEDLHEVKAFRRRHPNFDHASYDDGFGFTPEAPALDTAAEALSEAMRGATDDAWGDVS